MSIFYLKSPPSPTLVGKWVISSEKPTSVKYGICPVLLCAETWCSWGLAPEWHCAGRSHIHGQEEAWTLWINRCLFIRTDFVYKVFLAGKGTSPMQVPQGTKSPKAGSEQGTAPAGQCYPDLHRPAQHTASPGCVFVSEMARIQNL